MSEIVNELLNIYNPTLVPDICNRGVVDPCTKLILHAVWRYNC